MYTFVADSCSLLAAMIARCLGAQAGWLTFWREVRRIKEATHARTQAAIRRALGHLHSRELAVGWRGWADTFQTQMW